MWYFYLEIPGQSGLCGCFFAELCHLPELLRTEEKTIKAELLDEINAQLVLGKITGIFFSEYIFLD